MSAENKDASRPKILVVDDSEGIVSGFKMILEKHYEVKTATSPKTGLGIAKSDQPDLILLDVVFPGYDSGIALSPEYRKAAPLSFIAIMTGYPEEAEPFVPSCVGANTYIVKDAIAGKDRLLDHVNKFLSFGGNRPGSVRLLDQGRYPGFMGMVGQTRVMKDLFRLIQEVAQRDANVLICGETGTGKELVARAIHACSRRRDGPFVAVDSATLGSDLATSEIFGHVTGAFTGASKDHRGKLHRADKGSLFLDEVGNMPLGAQALLLRALEAKAIEPVGGEESLPADTRIISASNADLARLASEGRIRKDLLCRLHTLRIETPPLRDRPDDIPFLVEYLLDSLQEESGTEHKVLSSYAVEWLKPRSWPGNIRDLEAVLARSHLEATGGVIGRDEVARAVASMETESESSGDQARPCLPLRQQIAEFEKKLIACSLKRNAGNVRAASKELGIHWTRLYEKIDKYRLRHGPDGEAGDA